MPSKLVILGVAILSIVIIVGGFVTWAIVKPNQSSQLEPTASTTPNPTPYIGNTSTNSSADNSSTLISPTDNSENSLPDSSAVEQVRDLAMNYIETNHPESASVITSFSWTGGEQSTGTNDSETYIYSSSGWNVTIQFSDEPDPTFSITANYNSGTIYWVGSSLDGIIAEMSYSSDSATLLSAQNKIRDATMTYIRTKHPETATLMTSLQWAGQIDDSGTMGTTNYDYYSGGWTVVLQTSTTSPSSYIITVNYAGDDYISWQGTYQNSTILETSFSSSLPTPIPTPTPTPTRTPVPTPIPTPIKTPTPTPTPTRTPTPVPTPTRTPTPTPTTH